MNQFDKQLTAAAEVIFQLTEIKSVNDFSEVQVMAIAYLEKVGLTYSKTETLKDEEKFFDDINVRNINASKIKDMLADQLRDIEESEQHISDDENDFYNR